MRNRDVIGDEAIDFYLNGTVEDLYDGLLMLFIQMFGLLWDRKKKRKSVNRHLPAIR